MFNSISNLEIEPIIVPPNVPTYPTYNTTSLYQTRSSTTTQGHLAAPYVT